jgi:murein DD-endopeptidase MepM/ murein hydrolase activator NlpD
MSYTTKRKLTRLSAICLIAALIFAATPILHTSDIGAQSDKIADNKDKINDLQEQAAIIEQQNKEREERIAAYRNDIEQYDALMSEVNTQIDQIGAEINAYKNLIDAKQGQIDELSLKIETKELEIEGIIIRIGEKEREIEKINEENNENIEKFGEITAQMYMSSGGDAVSLLTGSTSFYDVLVRVEMIRNIGEKNVEIMESLLTAIKRQEEAIKELDEDRIQLEKEQVELETQQQAFGVEMTKLREERAVIAEEIERQYSALSDLTSEQQELQSNVDDIEDQVNAATKDIKGINAQIAELEETNKALEMSIRQSQQDNPDRPIYSTSGFRWPLDSNFTKVTDPYGNSGWRDSGWHSGTDIGNSGINGANVYAMQSGTVIKVVTGWGGGYGNHVAIDHGGGYSTLYAHMQDGSLTVSVGQTIERGHIIGRVGSTGWSTGPHLHFEVRKNGSTTNPMNYF